MRYFYYGKETEEKRGTSEGRKKGTEIHSASIRPQIYGKEEDLVIEEDTIYEVDKMCLSHRAGRK